jgi:hypothetical protein
MQPIDDEYEESYEESSEQYDSINLHEIEEDEEEV